MIIRETGSNRISLHKVLDFCLELNKIISDQKNISIKTLEVYLRIAADPYRTLGEIQDDAGMSQSQMYRITKKFEKAGLGNRERDPEDGKKISVCIVKEGQKIN